MSKRKQEDLEEKEYPEWVLRNIRHPYSDKRRTQITQEDRYLIDEFFNASNEHEGVDTDIMQRVINLGINPYIEGDVWYLTNNDHYKLGFSGIFMELFSRTLFGDYSDSYRFIADYMTDGQIETNILDLMHYDQAFDLMEILEEEERPITETMLTLLVSIAKVDLYNDYECYVSTELTNDDHMLRLFKFVIKHSNLSDTIADEKFPLQLFHVALDNCFLKCLDYLLSAGVDVNTREGLLPWISGLCKYDMSRAFPVIEIFLKYRFDFRMKHAKKNLFESILYSKDWQPTFLDCEEGVKNNRLLTDIKKLQRQDKVFKNAWDLWGILKSKDGVNKVFLLLNHKPREDIEETLDNLVKNRCEQDLEKETALYYELCELLEPFTAKVDALENYTGFILGEKE